MDTKREHRAHAEGPPRGKPHFPLGTSGTETGRPVRIVDGSGSYECHYDELGNVTEEIRTIALPRNNNEVYHFHMEYDYDSWGRIHTMVYPDGEKVKYEYNDWGGDLRSMHGVKNSNHRTYIREIRYNPFGQKKQVNYGNGTQVQYSYDALHRLAKLRSYDSLGNLMQKLDYTFDNASNITFIKNSAGVVNSLGGGYENNYHYDNLHRLTHSDGGGVAGNYDMDMAYTPSGRIIWKHRNAQSSSVPETVDMYYGYCDKYQPHAVKRMFDYKNGVLYDLRWDDAGNLGQVSMGRPGEMFEKGRFLFWTEDNRMHTAVNGKYYSYYAYDYGGERRLKLVGVNSSVDVNAEYMTAVSTLNEPTLYPSAYMVLTNKGYTKHYYAGTERVAARLGGGGNALHNVIENDGKLQTKADSLFDQCLEQVNSRVLKENDLECIMRNRFAKEEFGHWIEGIPYQMKADVECDHRLFKEMVDSMLTDYHNGEEKEVYFYHSDHLGSASWITDSAGIAVQHLQYLPYGEPYVNQHPAGYQERFTFTGKERDEETGYGYFGARYMDYSLMTMWLSVDPMADVSPNISPYHYCHWNPIRLTDPTGMLDDEWQLNVRTNELTWVSGKGGALHQTVTCICPDGSTIVHQGDGMLLRAESTWLGGNDYRVVTETGDLPQPSLFLTKVDGISTSLNLNSPMQTGSEISVPTIVPLGAGLYDGLGSSNIANQVAIRGDGTFMYARDKHNGFGKGLSWRNGTVMKNTTLGRLAYTTSRKVPALSMVTSGVEIGISWHQNGLDSRQTFKTIGGSVGGIVPSMIIGASIGGPVGFVVGFGVGIISSWLGEMGGGLFYDVTH